MFEKSENESKEKRRGKMCARVCERLEKKGKVEGLKKKSK